MKKVSFFLCIITLNFMQAQQTYLALGDSYTIGEGVPTNENWPNLLIQQLNEEGAHFQQPRIIATTGWRTDELQEAIKDSELDEDYDLVSLLIGVNNQYQKKPIEQYKKEFEELLQTAIAKSKRGHLSTFVVSIPDYGVTEFAKSKNLENVGKALVEYNTIAAQIAAKYQVPFYNITPVSINCEADETMFVEDLLHPSSKQYQLWVDVFYENVRELLKE